MALITCPECGKEVSDSAASCPHCGYVLNDAPTPRIRRTQLSAEESSGAGIPLVICGVFGLLFSVVLLIVALPFGVIGLLVSAAVISSGSTQAAGTQTGSCPYCGNKVTVPVKNTTCKCPHCHKTSTKAGDFLETID